MNPSHPVDMSRRLFANVARLRINEAASLLRTEAVSTIGRLLDSARADPSAVSFQVRPVDVVVNQHTPRGIAEARQTSFSSLGNLEGIQQVSSTLQAGSAPFKKACYLFDACLSSREGWLEADHGYQCNVNGRRPLTHQGLQAQAQQSGLGPSRGWAARARPQLPRPAFGSSPNLQALVLEAEERAEGPSRDQNLAEAAFYEVTIASADQPKLLSRLSEALVRHEACCMQTRVPRNQRSRCPVCPVTWPAPPHRACVPLTYLHGTLTNCCTQDLSLKRVPSNCRAT